MTHMIFLSSNTTLLYGPPLSIALYTSNKASAPLRPAKAKISAGVGKN